MNLRTSALIPGPDFVSHTSCVQCGKMVELRVPAPLDPFYILKYFMVDLGSKCKTCLEKAKQQQEKVR